MHGLDSNTWIKHIYSCSASIDLLFSYNKDVRLCIGLVGLALLPGLAGCGQEATADSANKRVSVFAAASMKDGLTDLAKQFEEAHPGTDVTMSFGGSQD